MSKSNILIRDSRRETESIAGCSPDFPWDNVKRLIHDYDADTCLGACLVYLQFYFRFFKVNIDENDIDVAAYMYTMLDKLQDDAWNTILFNNPCFSELQRKHLWDGYNRLVECRKNPIKTVTIYISSIPSWGSYAKWEIRSSEQKISSGISSNLELAKSDARSNLNDYRLSNDVVHEYIILSYK